MTVSDLWNVSFPKKKGRPRFFSFFFLFLFFGSLVGFDGTINTARTHEDT